MSAFLLHFGISLFCGILIGCLSGFGRLVQRSLWDASDV